MLHIILICVHHNITVMQFLIKYDVLLILFTAANFLPKLF